MSGYNEHTLIDDKEIQKQGFNIEFLNQLGLLSIEIPEIAESKDAIIRGAKDLSEKFGLHPEMFEDEAHSLLFMAISERDGRLEETDIDNQDFEKYAAEKEFIFDAMALLASTNSNLYPEYASSITPEVSISEEEEKLIFDKYTNEKVSIEFEKAINDGLLNDVKKRMGITAENETPYVIRVLNVASDISLAGMRPEITPDLDALPKDDPLWAEYYKKDDAYREYADMLKANAESFKLEKQDSDDVPVAWKTTIDGINNLILPLPFAEKIMNNQENGENSQSISDMSIFEHEYAHTQGGLLSRDNSLIGIAAEEFRAEKFSNNHNGFDDIKHTMMILNVIGVFDLDQVLEDEVKGGTLGDIVKKMIPYVGLQRTLEFCLTPPAAYAERTGTPLLSDVAKYLGGFNGFIERIYKDISDSPKSERATKRLAEMTMYLADNGQDIARCENYLNKIDEDGIPFGANLFRSELQKLKNSITI